MIASLAEAGALLGEPSWIEAAADAGRFLLDELRGDDRRWSRAWHTDGTPQARHAALGRRPRRADRRLHPARRGHRRGDLDLRGDGHGRHAARPLLGSGRGRPVHHARRRRGAGRPPEGPVRQRHAVGQLDRRRGRSVRLAALTGEAALRQPRRPHPAARRAARRRGAERLLQLARRARPAHPRHHRGRRRRRPSPTSSPSRARTGGPTPCWRGASAIDSPLWDGRTDGLAYVCRNYACQAPQDTPEGLRDQLAV